MSSDGTIRIWDLHTHQQLVEFDAPGKGAAAVYMRYGLLHPWSAMPFLNPVIAILRAGETVVCAAYHPKHYELACGFANGRLRVFDVATTTLVQVGKARMEDLVLVFHYPLHQV